MSFIPSTEFKAESPFVDKCLVDNANVVIKYNNELELTLIPYRDEQGRLGLEKFTLTYHDEDYAHYESCEENSLTLLKVSKVYLAELIQIALQDYLYWEYTKHSTVPEVVYKYVVAQTARVIADNLYREALV